MTETQNLNLTDIAFNNVHAWSRGAEPAAPWKLASDASDFQVGQVVAIFSRGNIRTAVVEKVGRKNITAIYVTEGGLKEGEKFRLNALHANAQSNAETARQQAVKNYDWHLAPHEGYDFVTPERNAELAAEKAAKAVEFLAANPDRDAYGQAAYDARLAETEARRAQAKELGIQFAVNVTSKTSAFDKTYIR